MIEGGGPGDVLLRLLQGLHLEGAERSFKMSDATLLDERYLLGIHKSDISPARLFDVCRGIVMPDDYLAELDDQAQAANAFHFGFEASPDGDMYKVYLEFASRLQAGGSDPVLVHLAYKWDCNDNRRATIARYVCHPGLPVRSILERLPGLYGDRAGVRSLAGAGSIIQAAARRSGDPLMYLEVSEDGNPRASFDIKLHGADMRVGEIEPTLDQMRSHYRIPLERFAPLLGKTASARLGHLSGGINRAGAEFLTVYYAVDAP